MNWGLAPTTVSTFTSQHLDVLSRGHALHGVLGVEHGPRVPLHEGVVDVGVRASQYVQELRQLVERFGASTFNQLVSGNSTIKQAG